MRKNGDSGWMFQDGLELVNINMEIVIGVIIGILHERLKVEKAIVNEVVPDYCWTILNQLAKSHSLEVVVDRDSNNGWLMISLLPQQPSARGKSPVTEVKESYKHLTFKPPQSSVVKVDFKNKTILKDEK